MDIPKADCFDCQFFYITWNKKFPYGCKAMTFKSRGYPFKLVFESSGMTCQSFKPRGKRKEI